MSLNKKSGKMEPIENHNVISRTLKPLMNNMRKNVPVILIAG